MSNTIKDILLGQAPQSINERHYVNRRTIKISEKVQQANTEIMEDFKFEKLAMILYLNMINFLSNKDKKTAERIILSELFQGQTLLEQHKKNNQIT